MSLGPEEDLGFRHDGTQSQGEGQGESSPRVRRPAQRERPGLRRPAAAEGSVSQWDRGQPVALAQVPLAELGGGSSLVFTEADYFGAIVEVAGKVTKLEVADGEAHLQLSLTGTKSEDVLKQHTAHPQRPFRVHVCPQGCSREESGDCFLHGLKARKMVAGGDEPWTRNLLGGPEDPAGEDELEALRKRSQALAGDARPPGQEEEPIRREKSPKKKKEEDQSSEKRKKKKKKRGRSKGRVFWTVVTRQGQLPRNRWHYSAVQRWTPVGRSGVGF